MDRDEQLAELATEKHRPAGLLPWFELCAYVHAMARAGRLDVDAFRACWFDLVARHADMNAAGLLLHLDEWDLGADALLQVIYELKRPPQRDSSSSKKDARDADDAWNEEVLRRRFQDLHERAISRLNERLKAEKQRSRYGTPPRELPENKYPARPGTLDIVVDTNVLVELLNVLPIRDQSGTRVDLSRLDRPFRTSLLPALSHGIGKLIVPVPVLIEAEGVIAKYMLQGKKKYERADKVLRHMAVVPYQSRSAAFSFEAMDQTTFAAFLCLLERLTQDGIPGAWWPTLGDALVLAHGMANGCPVASYEWMNKDDWSRTRLDEAFPYLVLK